MSVEKEQLFKVGDKVKILPTILADYPDFPYVGIIGRVCTVTRNGIQIGIEFSCPRSYLQIFGSILNKSEVLLEFN